MPGDFRCDRGDYARMLVLFCMRGCGCIVRPAFPAPSIIEGHCLAKLGRIAPRECGVVSRFDVIARSKATKQINLGHSGMVRRTRPQMRNCASGNLEIPGSMRSLSSGRALRGPVGIAPE